MIRLCFFLFVVTLILFPNFPIAFSQDSAYLIDEVDITIFSHPDIAESKRGGGWICNSYSGGATTTPTNRLAAFTWSPIGAEAKIIYYSAVIDNDYFHTGQMGMILAQFDLTDLHGYKINDARLVLRDNWNGASNEFAFGISRILSGPEWIPFPESDPLYGHEWADGRSNFETPNGYRIDAPTVDLSDPNAIQAILDSEEWPEEIIQGSCWAFRNENADPWIPSIPAGKIGMIHEMKTWDSPDGRIRAVGGTQSVSSSIADLLQGWVSGRYQNNGLVIHPSVTLTPFDLSLDSAVVSNVHGGWHNYNQGSILLAVDAEAVDPPITESFRDDAQTAVGEWFIY
ncbi:MAG: hypothetical protein C4527_19715 [Candidatus Omnitrophota bacterium]|jgi:hypothetical protein|nr:MAG: hypothetical protein C4527_19715 [Candidatus Omnitrophota bacterium]